MNNQEINAGIKEVCKTSLEVASFYNDNNALIQKLNSVPHDELEKASNYYATRTGVIVDLRKDVLNYLKEGKILDEEVLNGFVVKHRTGNENRYRSYKNNYTIFFPFITFYGHNYIRDFIESFITEIINRLNLDGLVKHTYFDFQGARQQGSDRLWLAIYNKKQETQSTGLQLFLDFHKGKVKYGVYQHSDQSYIKGPIETLPEAFNFDDMLSFFEANKNLIIGDKPKDSLTTILLKDRRIYKLSHGSFKTKALIKTLETFKENQWAVIHEHTGKGQGEAFKNELTEGDYVYITIGAEELFAIAKIKAGSWSFVPEDITGENGWIYREVEYVKTAINSDPSPLKSYKEFIYPSGNSTFTEITVDKINEANERIFKPHFGIQFISERATQLGDQGELPKYPNNIILYGPPGTGKTYHTIDKAVEIIQGIASTNHDDNKKIFDTLKKEGQIEFITFHQNYSYEDFMVGIRPDIASEQLTFKPHKGIFYEIAKKARDNYKASSNEQPKERTFQEVFSELTKPLTEKGEPFKVQMTSGVNYTITDISDYSIHFSKPNGTSKHTLSIQTLEEIVDGTRDFNTGLGPYYNPLANLIRLRKKDVRVINTEKKKRFVLIIDEINRANISKVFGELITLLEEDKRIGSPNELRITLPNLEKEFGLPPNLYIIGTMNTADKSIALLDIALRRRFEFDGRFPDPSKLNDSDGQLLKALNKEIYSRKKSADYLIGHAYFMSGIETEKVLKNKVIPLLMEYFSGKTEIVEEIFKASEWSVQYNIERYEWVIQSGS